MQSYSFHSYGKTGNQLAASYLSLVKAVNNSKIPVIVTEHNTRTSNNYDSVATTPDSPNEASRLTSQILWLIQSGIRSDYVFKFTISPSLTNAFVKRTGLHWCESTTAPYHLSDTTLAAEGIRLLSKTILANIYKVNADTTKFNDIAYLASSNGDGFSYLYIVNEGAAKFRTTVNLTQSGLSFNGANLHVVESVGSGFYGEISSIQSGSVFNLSIDAYSVHRVAIQTGAQSVASINAHSACTLFAGSKSSLSNCTDSSVYVGTSNTAEQKNTAVALIQFTLPAGSSSAKRTLLKVFFRLFGFGCVSQCHIISFES
jgi:hypothetical protein